MKVRPVKLRLKKALLVVDVQNDFCPGGALGVREGDKIVPVLNKYIAFFKKNNLPIFATRDWHPRHTKHFKKFGGIWPVHCVQNTPGAQFHKDLKLPKEAILLYKGMDPNEESYSSFHAVDSNGTHFISLLKIFGIEELYIGGLATDYCVKFTTADAYKNGFKVKLLMDAIKGVNIKPKDSELAIAEMVNRGAKKITLKELTKKRL